MLATKEKSHPGFQLPTAILHPGFGFAISNTATSFHAALYDFRIGPLCSGYFRDAETGLDYADQRYHQPGMGRFTVPDRYTASGGPSDPGSWNRYAYVGGDPINYSDPTGEQRAAPGAGDGPVICDPFDIACIAYNGGSVGGGGIAGGGIGGGICGPGDYFNAEANSCETAGASEDPPPSPCSNWGCMPAALATAINALKTHQQCADLFGNATTQAGAFNPVDVIQQVFKQGGSTIAGQSVSATFQPIVLWSALTIPNVGGGATVVIDSVNYDLWNSSGSIGDSYWQAILLLHELGHVYNDLKGSGGSKIGGDGFGGSDANTNLIKKDCFQ
jgi:RHS repeat-associated protein